MDILTSLPFLASDVEKQLNKIPSFNYEDSMKNIKPAFHLKYVPGASTVNFFGSIIKGLDILLIFALIAGFVMITFAAVQNNGRWKRVGYATTIATWIITIFSHFMIAGGLAYKSFFAHWKDAAMILITQVMLFAIPAVLYYLAASNLEFYEFSSNTNFLETAQKQYRYLPGVMMLAIAAYIILGVVL